MNSIEQGLSSKQQMFFNIKKCKIVLIRKQQAVMVYDMKGWHIDTVTEEQDLGVVIRNDLKSSSMCAQENNKLMRLTECFCLNLFEWFNIR